MSESGSVSLDMLQAQLDAADDAVCEAILKRRQIERTLRDARKSQGLEVGFSPALTLRQARRALRVEGLEGEAALWTSLLRGSLEERGISRVLIAGAEPVRVWDQARAFFGHNIELVQVAEPVDALDGCVEDETLAAVLPWLGSSLGSLWWPKLNESRYRALRSVAAWPAPGLSDEPLVSIVNQGDLASSGDDLTLAVAFDDTHRALKLLTDHDLTVRELGRARALVLLEIDGFVAGDDPRLLAATSAGLEGLRVVGVAPRLG